MVVSSLGNIFVLTLLQKYVRFTHWEKFEYVWSTQNHQGFNCVGHPPKSVRWGIQVVSKQRCSHKGPGPKWGCPPEWLNRHTAEESHIESARMPEIGLSNHPQNLCEVDSRMVSCKAWDCPRVARNCEGKQTMRLQNVFQMVFIKMPFFCTFFYTSE